MEDETGDETGAANVAPFHVQKNDNVGGNAGNHMSGNIGDNVGGNLGGNVGVI